MNVPLKPLISNALIITQLLLHLLKIVSRISLLFHLRNLGLVLVALVFHLLELHLDHHQ